MLLILLYVYLVPAVSITTYHAFVCEPNRVMSKGECVALGTIKGAAWPVIVGLKIRDKFSK